MMRNPTVLNCCNSCPEGQCAPVGTAVCDIPALHYYRAVRSGVLIGPGEDECATEVLDYVESFDEVPMEETSTPCVWETEYPGVGKMQLNILSADDATLTLTVYGSPNKTVVWKSSDCYDPLCPSQFVYSPQLSDPPASCKWWTEMCVDGEPACCPDIRSFPERLFVSLEMVNPGSVDPDCNCGDGIMADDEVVWDPQLQQYRGTVSFGTCGTYLDIMIQCNEIIPSPGPRRHQYELFIQLRHDPPFSGSPGCVPDNLQGDIDVTASCVPFIFSTYVEGSGFCCPGGMIIPFILYFTEVPP